MADRTVQHATCLGCGCTCDDITVVARGGRIVEARQACALGVRWFGDGAVPARLRIPGSVDDRPPSVTTVLAVAASLLRAAASPLVYLAGDVSCEAQRASIAIADVLDARLDNVTSSTARAGTLAAQRRGRATATLGELRNRADIIAFWGVDPGIRYPRFQSRYAPDPAGLHIPEGRRSRSVCAIDIDADRGPSDADTRIAFSAEEEVPALDLIRVAVLGRADPHAAADSLAGRAAALADQLCRARYLAEALNGPTRCVLTTLRGGGNRCGAESTMTAQTGYPMAVDFGRGTPRYCPDDAAEVALGRGDVDVALIVGAPDTVPEGVRSGLRRVARRIAIGPRASESPYEVHVAIDTGVAGIHERGCVVRLDEIPLPLRPALEPALVAALRDRVGPASAGVALATISRVHATADAASAGGYDYAHESTHDHASDAAARTHGESPELTAADALAAAGLPQDSYVILRTLGATLARMIGIA